MDKPGPERKRIRLNPSTYEIPGLAASITLCSLRKERIFTEHGLCSAVIESMQESMKAYGMDVIAYCLMPSHLHAVFHNLKGMNLCHAIRDFKQRTQFRMGRSLWQRSFY